MISFSRMGIQEAAQALLKAVHMPGANTATCLNSTLNQFLPRPFRAGSICIIDSEEKNTNYDTAIYTDSESQSENQPAEVKADVVACGVHVVGNIGSEELQAGYERIAVIKRLKRTQIPEIDGSVNNTPLGIIFAVNSDIPMDKIGELMISLNKSFPSSEWPDMVAILTRGTINYAVQIYGEPIGGDFLLPNRTGFPVMPMYVHLFARGLELFSMNKMCNFILMHLQTFSPSTRLPKANEILENVSPSGITLGAYQFNQKCQLVPVPNELYSKEGILGPPLLRVEDKNGNLLSHLQFIPWQDGGAVRLIGKLPLDMILAFLGSVATNAQIIKQSAGAISSVLPIRKAQFREMLERFQKQSNMNIKAEKPNWIIQKTADEGTASPFMARLYLGILNLRDNVFVTDKERKEFDNFYHVVLDTLMNARATSKEIIQTLNEYSHKVSQGKIVRLDGHTTYIAESVDGKLRKQVEAFLNGSVRVVKDGMQSLLGFLKLNIGFLYQKQRAFEKGIVLLTRTQPKLAAYLQETRKWSERLILVRNDLHKGWMLPNIGFNKTSEGIQIVEPQISGHLLSEFVEYMLDRLCCFVEEVTAYGLQTNMPPEVSITEIPISDRKAECRERFQITLAAGGMPIWNISYHVSKFGET